MPDQLRTQLSHITSLEVSGRGPHVFDMSELRAFPDLTSLDLRANFASGPGLNCLRHLRNLQSLRMSADVVADSELAVLQALPSLESVCLDGRPIGNEGLLHLSKLATLRHLTFQIDEHSRRAGAYMQRLPLTSLRLSGKVDTELLTNLASIQTLRTLEISSPDLRDEGIGHLGRLAGLEILTLSGIFDGSCMTHFARHPNLKRLYLRSDQIKVRALKYLLKLPAQVKLELDGTQISRPGLLQLERARPDVSIYQ